MSFQLPYKRTAAEGERIRWSGAAVLVEAMLLLVFLIASLAVLVQMFATAVNCADESAQLTAAVAAASDMAEQFAADPTNIAEETNADGLLVVCDVKAEPRKAGTLYHAEISVYAADADASAGAVTAPAGDPVYSVSTSRFESEVER